MNKVAKGIRELKEGEQVEHVFLVRSKQGLVTKNGNPYVSLKLGDRTGEIDAKIWDRADDLSPRFKKDDFVRVRGVVSSFQGVLQITVRDLDPVPPDQVAVEEFLPASKRSLDEMAAAFRQIADSVGSPHIRALILSFADDEAFMNRLKRAPAAKGMHHVYIGGLIEHILDLVGLARDVVPHFPWVDPDLVVAGCVFHDVGKVAELKYERSFDYSTEGHLLGHIAIGYEWVSERMRSIPGFPDDLAMRIKHLILAHHGELEFGSPKVPMTPEAFVVHHLDNLCAKLDSVREFIAQGSGEEGESGMTPYHKILGRYLYRGPSRIDGSIGSEGGSEGGSKGGSKGR